MQEQLLKLLLAVTDGQGAGGGPGRDRRSARRWRAATRPASGARWRIWWRATRTSSAEQMQVGRAVIDAGPPGGRERHPPGPELTHAGPGAAAARRGRRAPSTPISTPTRSCGSTADSIMRRHMLKRLSPGQLFASALEMQELRRSSCPARLNTRAGRPGRQQAGAQGRRLRRDPADGQPAEDRQPHRARPGAGGAHRGRGAADAGARPRFRIFGYPGLAMLLFLLAAACGFVLDPQRLPQRRLAGLAQDCSAGEEPP